MLSFSAKNKNITKENKNVLKLTIKFISLFEIICNGWHIPFANQIAQKTAQSNSKHLALYII